MNEQYAKMIRAILAMRCEERHGPHREWFSDDGGYFATIGGPYKVYTVDGFDPLVAGPEVDKIRALSHFLGLARIKMQHVLSHLSGDDFCSAVPLEPDMYALGAFDKLRAMVAI